MNIKNIRNYTFKPVEEIEEELETNEETAEIAMDEVIDMAYKFYKKSKTRIFTRGLAYGALGAVAIQSIITILVLIK